ncbi:MAG TPA: bifunctional sulfate adenylyltransferase/adenylylsulfate kinase [Pyrinomonadaceae bacterium]|nr:bifunctional sulfate adenylyltransferase/adenylylsulfate kinase [Pyrinomonadaceae bacterium]
MATGKQPPGIKLISPYGGTLVDLTVAEETAIELKQYANHLASLRLSERAVCDLELLATGAFSPLDRFMGQADHERVLREMRLVNGYVFPIPVTLPLENGSDVRLNDEVALRDSRNELLAVMNVEEVYECDLEEVAASVLGTNDLRHPFVAEMHRWGRLSVSGKLRVIQLPRRYDFRELRLNPGKTRERLTELGHQNVVAFQTRNPLHRAHEEITKRATEQIDGALLLHPVVGLTKPGDVDHYTRVRTYKTLAAHYAPDRIVLSLLPLAMRLAGPREALWHAIIRRNYGANHMIIGRDHASPGVNSNGEPFYEPYAAQELAQQFSEEIGVGILPFHEFVYLPEQDRYEEVTQVPETTRTAFLSGTQVREDYLRTGKPLPSWFMRPEVAEILAETYPPRHKQGVCIWFTGLSGAGKSTTAEILTVLLQEHGRQVTVLDGDVVRTHLSRGLGFSKEDRDLNIRRIGFVAAEIVRHGGMVVCAAVSPYRATRNDVRNLIGAKAFVEVFVDTPLAECERRDTKGIYASARRGEIKNFTGIDDPYEPPLGAEITLSTINQPPEENARLIFEYLLDHGFIRANPREPSIGLGSAPGTQT